MSSPVYTATSTLRSNWSVLPLVYLSPATSLLHVFTTHCIAAVRVSQFSYAAHIADFSLGLHTDTLHIYTHVKTLHHSCTHTPIHTAQLHTHTALTAYRFHCSDFGYSRTLRTVFSILCLASSTCLRLHATYCPTRAVIHSTLLVLQSAIQLIPAYTHSVTRINASPVRPPFKPGASLQLLCTFHQLRRLGSSMCVATHTPSPQPCATYVKRLSTCPSTPSVIATSPLQQHTLYWFRLPVLPFMCFSLVTIYAIYALRAAHLQPSHSYRQHCHTYYATALLKRSARVRSSPRSYIHASFRPHSLPLLYTLNQASLIGRPISSHSHSGVVHSRLYASHGNYRILLRPSSFLYPTGPQPTS